MKDRWTNELRKVSRILEIALALGLVFSTQSAFSSPLPTNVLIDGDVVAFGANCHGVDAATIYYQGEWLHLVLPEMSVTADPQTTITRIACGILVNLKFDPGWQYRLANSFIFYSTKLPDGITLNFSQTTGFQGGKLVTEKTTLNGPLNSSDIFFEEFQTSEWSPCGGGRGLIYDLSALLTPTPPAVPGITVTPPASSVSELHLGNVKMSIWFRLKWQPC